MILYYSNERETCSYFLKNGALKIYYFLLVKVAFSYIHKIQSINHYQIVYGIGYSEL